MCCSYEYFADHTYECSLYATNEVYPIDKAEYKPGHEELSMLFVKGDTYSLKTYTVTVKATMVEEGCDEECVYSMTGYDAESVDGDATDCSCSPIRKWE